MTPTPDPTPQRGEPQDTEVQGAEPQVGESVPGVEPGVGGDAAGAGDGGAAGAGESGPGGAAGPRSPGWRPRAVRGFATCVVVAVGVVVAGALLYDVVAVRTGHQARPWRAEVAQELATRQLDDPWVLASAGVAVALGVLLLWLAFAPGLRRWLPLERRGSAIHRSAVAAQIAAKAADLPDAHAAKVRVTRRRTRVTVTGAFDPAAVERALRVELSRIPLAVPHRLDVRNLPLKHPHPRHPHHRGLEQEPQ